MYNFLKFFAVIGCSLLAQSGFAQFSKGSLLVGGGISFSNTQNQSGSADYYNPSGQTQVNNGTYIGIFPNLSYAIKDNWVASFETGFSSNSGSERSINTNTTTTENNYRIPITLGIRHYWNLGKKFHLGLGIGTGIGIRNNNRKIERDGSSDFNDTKGTGLDWNIGISPNLNYLLGDRVLLSLSSGYWGYYQSKGQSVNTYNVGTEIRNSTNDYNYSSFSGNLSLNNIQIGAYYSIQPKAKKTE